jgi:Domain of unknown function (DUF4397)
MKLRIRVVCQLAALLLLGAFSFAADNAYLYIVQGIPGRDIADNVNPGLPVDVLINGKSCVVRGLAFGSVSGPLSFSAGTYDVQISEADTLAGCSNPALINAQVVLTANQSVSAVAAITGDQTSLIQFTDNLAPVLPGNARFVFAQTADAPALQATLTQLNVKNPQTFTLTAAPGTQQWIGVPAGTYLVSITASGETIVLTSEQIGLADQSVTFAYAAGESVNNSVGLVTRAVRDVF